MGEEKFVSKYSVENFIQLLDGYFEQGGQHINFNVLIAEILIEAKQNPER